ncbi:hypothetical protein HPB51_002057 [Rhipicephalus microplus]|uniref:Ig-like domain-containing protein n=1 Tax=Rhipicephalus microplus TaxID=6941 RepID=A0A9J6DRS7_RHIMP|nr:hypothetical protein HPB51_002057 [Rhipicephalus microplus]
MLLILVPLLASLPATLGVLASRCDATHGTSGPRWLNELPARLLFSNWTGATVRCLAEGEPRPDVWWVSAADGLNASALPVASRAQLLAVHDGTLTFLPFREHQFREQLHRGSFRCHARNTRGTVLSTVVHVSAATHPSAASLLKLARVNHPVARSRGFSLYRKYGDRKCSPDHKGPIIFDVQVAEVPRFPEQI